MKKGIVFSIAAAFIIGCGGGSSSDSTATTPTTTSNTISGIVADGLIFNAKVCVDLNYNKECDSDEPYDITNASGEFTINSTQDILNKPIIADLNYTIFKKDSSLGYDLPNVKLFAFSTKSNITVSPFTTLAALKLYEDKSKGINIDSTYIDNINNEYASKLNLNTIDTTPVATNAIAALSTTLLYKLSKNDINQTALESGNVDDILTDEEKNLIEYVSSVSSPNVDIPRVQRYVYGNLRGGWIYLGSQFNLSWLQKEKDPRYLENYAYVSSSGIDLVVNKRDGNDSKESIFNKFNADMYEVDADLKYMPKNPYIVMQTIGYLGEINSTADAEFFLNINRGYINLRYEVYEGDNEKSIELGYADINDTTVHVNIRMSINDENLTAVVTDLDTNKIVFYKNVALSDVNLSGGYKFEYVTLQDRISDDAAKENNVTINESQAQVSLENVKIYNVLTSSSDVLKVLNFTPLNVDTNISIFKENSDGYPIYLGDNGVYENYYEENGSVNTQSGSYSIENGVIKGNDFYAVIKWKEDDIAKIVIFKGDNTTYRRFEEMDLIAKYKPESEIDPSDFKNIFTAQFENVNSDELNGKTIEFSDGILSFSNGSVVFTDKKDLTQTTYSYTIEDGMIKSTDDEGNNIYLLKVKGKNIFYNIIYNPSKKTIIKASPIIYIVR